MIRFIHAADLHLDSAFVSLDPEEARLRRQELRDLPEKLAELARGRKADLVLLPGDLFDGSEVYPETVERLRLALERMACPVFIAPGNHDPCTAASPYLREKWPDNVHIFTERELTEVRLDALGCVVHGAAFTDADKPDEVLAEFSAPADGLIHILCLHGNVGDTGGRYGPITKEQIARSGADYLALGHVHQHGGLKREGPVFWAYPGCPAGRGFDELGDKGALYGEIEKGQVRTEFVSLTERRYRVLRLDVTGAEPGRLLDEALTAEMERDLCRVIFTGETGERGVDLPGLEAEFAHRVCALQLRDETVVERDLWERAGEDSLRGLFLELLRQRGENADEAEREKIARAVRFGLAAMDGRDLG